VTQTLDSSVVAGLDPATQGGRATNLSESDLWMLGSSPSITTWGPPVCIGGLPPPSALCSSFTSAAVRAPEGVASWTDPSNAISRDRQVTRIGQIVCWADLDRRMGAAGDDLVGRSLGRGRLPRQCRRQDDARRRWMPRHELVDGGARVSCVPGTERALAREGLGQSRRCR
jgi:hypothetical protein